MKGRTFLPEEDQPGQNHVVLVSYGLWQRAFGADPNLVGRTLLLSDESYTVVGIMPPHFQFPKDADLWIPIALDLQNLDFRGSRYLSVIARLKSGATVNQAQANMDLIARRLQQEYPHYPEDSGWGISVVPLLEDIIGDIRPALLLLFGAVGFVLLICCANVANLLLVRVNARGREIAVRSALGAGWVRLIRQMLTESMLLAVVGGAFGLVLAIWMGDLLVAVTPANIPRWEEIRIDANVLAFALAVSLLTAVIFGSIPALRAFKPNLTESLKEGARRTTQASTRRNAQNLLVISEVALATVLLIGAWLMIKSLFRLQKTDAGFNPANVLTTCTFLPESRYSEPHKVSLFYQQVLEQLESQPEVQSVGAISALPLTWGEARCFATEGRPFDMDHAAEFRVISPGYFRAMGIPLLRGRYFSERDVENSAGVIIVNETMARLSWPNEDPLSKHLAIEMSEGKDEREVVGVVGNVKQYGLDTESRREVYVPYLQRPRRSMILAVRSRSDPMNLTKAVRHAVRTVDKDQPVFNTRTMEDVVSGSISRPRFNVLLLGVFSAMGLVLAAIGTYGVISYSVSQRTHEIGIRMALGAQTTDVLMLVLRQGFKLTLIGVGVGLAAALALTRVISSLLYEVSPTDPLTFFLVSLLLVAVALLASYIPARRATKVDPVVALRYE